MKEIDDFLPRHVTPVLSPRGFRKSGHAHRKGFESGDWAIFSFRGYPVGIRGSFLAEASFVPGPVWDWFVFTRPDLATKQPQGWWLEWSNPLGPHHADSNWIYENDIERELVGSMLADRLNEVATLFDELAVEPTRLLWLVLSDEQHEFGELPHLGSKLRSTVWRACLLAQAELTQELEKELAEADPYPNLGLRAWAEHYARRAQD